MATDTASTTTVIDASKNHESDSKPVESSSSIGVARRATATKPFDATTVKGSPDGLFRSCMKAIRAAHFQSNRLRAMIVVTGLFTDKFMYREVIAIFYIVTKELEEKLIAMSKTNNDNETKAICQSLLGLGYRFTEQYEKDLAFLYESNDDTNINTTNNNWKDQVEAVVNQTPAARFYRDKIRSMTQGAELAGAAFVLWGALIIGGGAVAMPRVKARYGELATHIYQAVTGPGREQRKRAFIQTWDALPSLSSEKDDCAHTSGRKSSDTLQIFVDIERSAQECMQCNNNVLSSIVRNPWWIPSLATSLSSAIVVLAVTTALRSYYMS